MEPEYYTGQEVPFASTVFLPREIFQTKATTNDCRDSRKHNVSYVEVPAARSGKWLSTQVRVWPSQIWREVSTVTYKTLNVVWEKQESRQTQKQTSSTPD